MADFGPADLDAFRVHVRDWLAANFPASLAEDPAGQVAWMYGYPEPPEGRAWRQAMGSTGWGVPHWPKAYGGGGLSKEQIAVLGEEMARIGARNPIGGLGVLMFGPTLLEFGSEELKRQHIPGIARAEVRWCQGYSEPNAGSDLASLQTRAEDKGDHWLVNGSKIWTSYAHMSDWCFCLVRTDPTQKHAGISFLLIDMKTPGVEARPIPLINGASPFCETFFTDVKVPKDQLFGPLNGGWTLAKRLLQHERTGISAAMSRGAIGTSATPVSPLQAALEHVGLDADGRLADPDLRMRLTEHLMSHRAFNLTLARAAAEAQSANGPSNAAAITKSAGATLMQQRSELVIEAMGQQGLGWDGEGFDPRELEAVRLWLRAKANSIEGGTSEVNLNVISKRVLGLPDRK